MVKSQAVTKMKRSDFVAAIGGTTEEAQPTIYLGPPRLCIIHAVSLLLLYGETSREKPPELDCIGSG